MLNRCFSEARLECCDGLTTQTIWVSKSKANITAVSATFGFNPRSALPVLSKQMPSSTQSSVAKSLLIWSLWQLPSFSAPLSVQLSVCGDFYREMHMQKTIRANKKNKKLILINLVTKRYKSSYGHALTSSSTSMKGLISSSSGKVIRSLSLIRCIVV